MAKLNLKDSLGSIMEKASVKAEEIGETVSETAKEGLKMPTKKPRTPVRKSASAITIRSFPISTSTRISTGQRSSSSKTRTPARPLTCAKAPSVG